jgi:hypothetical protein
MAMGKIGIVAASTAAAAAALFGGSAIANAATGRTASTSATAAAYTSGAPSGSTDAQVTGDELAKVTAAVEAKDSSVTVTRVQKDPDGSYDVFATKSGSQLMYEVSADLKTITQGGGAGHGGGPGGSTDTPVTGDELAKVTAAVKAKDSSVAITRVQKDPDGSYDVFGTKSGSQVMYEVSADLTTITQNTVNPDQSNGSQSNSSNATTSSSATT